MALQLFKIETVEVASPVSSITFSNIPQGYIDLKLVVSSRVDAAAVYQSIAMSFNGGSPTSAFTQRWLVGDGVSVASSNYGANTALYPFYSPGANATLNTFGSGEIYICNYANTSIYKSVSCDGVTETNATNVRAEIGTMLWSSNNAVTSITLQGNTNFVTNSTFTLYGVL